MDDLISRQEAIEALQEHRNLFCDNTPETFSGLPYSDKCRVDEIDNAIATLINLPSAQPTLYGYPVEHLAMIATVLQKENLPPERISEMLSDIGRIVDMVRDEFEETLRKAVEQCMMT